MRSNNFDVAGKKCTEVEARANKYRVSRNLGSKLKIIFHVIKLQPEKGTNLKKIVHELFRG